jgi:hypothetical protein
MILSGEVLYYKLENPRLMHLRLVRRPKGAASLKQQQLQKKKLKQLQNPKEGWMRKILKIFRKDELTPSADGVS